MRKSVLFAIILVTGLLLAVPANAGHDAAVPPAGLNAEMAGDWEEAVKVYRRVLEREPDRVDLWLRISDIEAHLGDLEDAAQALAEAARLAPDDAHIHFRLSQAYSMNDQPQLALAAVSRSVELEPDNIIYLRAQAELANWTGRSDLAASTYGHILQISPEDDSALLNYARSSAWSGHIDVAAKAYEEYLSDHPDEEVIYIEHVKVESWRGNYVGSMSILESYREAFGESDEYQAEKARVLAWAGQPSEAMTLITPLLHEHPDDYDLNYTRTIALNNNNQPSEAVDSLQTLIELRPDSKGTFDIQKFVTTRHRPDVTLAGSFYTDSDDLDRYRGSIMAGFSPKPETRLTVGGQTDYLKADRGSGFEKLDGGEEARHHSGWVGISHIFSPEVSADGHIGGAEAEGEGRFIYGAGLNYRPKDNLRLRADTDYGFYVISPRSVYLGIRRSSNHLSVNWRPNLVYAGTLILGYNDFSDGNESWEAIIAPRCAVLRRAKINLDIGLRGSWYGFREQLDNGYYDPELYQSYVVTSLLYWKISDDDGVSLAVDLGVVKDDEMNSFRFGLGASVEGVFGIYRDVMLRVGGGILDNQRTASGSFNAYEAHIALTFRF